MIILVTGTPGAGKTLYTVSELLNKQFKNRPQYINHIPNLLIPHELFSGDGDVPAPDSDVLNWFDGRVPANSVICIDEAQRVFRPRSSGSAVPAHVAKLETHRHQGLDIIIITQHPQLIDANVRRLVGRHIHVRRAWGMAAAIVYEWDSCANNVNAVKQAQSKVWRYDKSAYKLYKSSELHTKAGGKIPWVLKLAVVMLVAAPLMWLKTADSMKKRFGGEIPEVTSAIPAGTHTGADLNAMQQQSRPLTASEYAETLRPRFGDMQHTASRYDEITKPQRVPLPAACIQSRAVCKCYTQDGTHYPISQASCVSIVQNGAFYDFTSTTPTQREQAITTRKP